MKDTADSAVARLWRDRAQLREQERDEAQTLARIAGEKAAALTAENDRLMSQNAHLSDQNNRIAVEVARLTAQNERLTADIAWLKQQLAPKPAELETEQQMAALRTELLSLLDPAIGNSRH